MVLWECLENIKKLKHLTHLTLDGLPILNGKFLLAVSIYITIALTVFILF